MPPNLSYMSTIVGNYNPPMADEDDWIPDDAQSVFADRGWDFANGPAHQHHQFGAPYPQQHTDFSQRQQSTYSPSPSPDTNYRGNQYATSSGLALYASMGHPNGPAHGTRLPLGTLDANLPPTPQTPAAHSYQQKAPKTAVEPFKLPPPRINFRIDLHIHLLDHKGPRSKPVRQPKIDVHTWSGVHLTEMSYHEFLNALLVKVGAEGIFIIEDGSVFSFKYWKGGVLSKDSLTRGKAATVSCEDAFFEFAVAHRQEVILDIDKETLQNLRSAGDVEKRRSFMADKEVGEGGSKRASLDRGGPNRLGLGSADQIEMDVPRAQACQWLLPLRNKRLYWDLESDAACVGYGNCLSPPRCFTSPPRLDTQPLVLQDAGIDGIDVDHPPNGSLFTPFHTHKKTPRARGLKRHADPSSSSDTRSSSPPPDASLTQLRPFLQLFDKLHNKSFEDLYFTALDAKDYAPSILANLHKKEKYEPLVEMGMSENNAMSLCLFATKLDSRDGAGKAGKQKQRRRAH
ncbi:hypothetical protein P7C70_g4758, partial [Phenoliferia sp. Uapishka_3]